MKANFDNMRRAATENMNELGQVLKEQISRMDNYDIDGELKTKIIDAFNWAGYQVDCLNCLYDDNVKDDVNDLSDVIEVELLKHEDVEEDDDEL